MTKRQVLALLAAGTASLTAQQVTVPAAFAQSDANGLTEFAGFTQRFREQIIIDGQALTALRSTSLVELRVRRDGQYGQALSGGRANLTIAATVSSRALTEASPDFATNAPNPTAIFQGTISLPDSPALTSRNQPTFASPFAVVIPLQTPFAYGGQQLVLDIQGTPDTQSTSRWWPIDAHYEGVRGSAVTHGTACDSRCDLHVAAERLVPGATLRFVAGGPAGGTNVLALAAQRSSPVDLGILGFPGCTLHLTPDLMFTTGASLGFNGSAGTANHLLHLPSSQQLLATPLASQAITMWIDSQAPALRLATSPALDLTLAARYSTHAAVVVTSGLRMASDPWPTRGEVQVARVPVLQLRAQ